MENAPLTSLSVAIIGTREPDKWQEMLATNVAYELSRHGIRVTTGGADGIDYRAMHGCIKEMLDVYLPWWSYNKDRIPLGVRTICYEPRQDVAWTQSVTKYHPAPSRLSCGAFALHARNFGILSGRNAVLALPGPGESGGTGQGIRIARDLGIPLIVRCRGQMDHDETTEVMATLRGYLNQAA